MAKIVKTLSVASVMNGESGAKPVSAEKAEDYIRDYIVSNPNVSQNELLALVGKKFPAYGYSSFKIAFSRYTAVMRQVKLIYNITLKSTK